MVRTPGKYGIIVVKNGHTQDFQVRQRERVARWMRQFGAHYETAPSFFEEDSHLFAASVAMNHLDLEADAEELEADGAVRGVDFVLTASSCGVLDEPLPPWLREEVVPCVISPELRAKATAEELAAWERARFRTYAFVAA